MKFHEEIDQFIEEFKGELIGQHFRYLLNTKSMFMNRGGHDLKTTNYGEHLTFCNPERRRKRAPASSMKIAGIKAENEFIYITKMFAIPK